MWLFLRNYDVVAGDWTTNTFTPDLEVEGHTFNMDCTFWRKCVTVGKGALKLQIFRILLPLNQDVVLSAPAQHLTAWPRSLSNGLSSVREPPQWNDTFVRVSRVTVSLHSTKDSTKTTIYLHSWRKNYGYVEHILQGKTWLKCWGMEH